MNKRLVKLLENEREREREWKGGELLDCYDNVVVEDICITITTRISASCCTYIVVNDDER